MTESGLSLGPNRLPSTETALTGCHQPSMRTTSLVWAPLIVSVTILCQNAMAVDFHVATSGKDSNHGTEAQPFATLERARNAVRQSRKARASTDQMTVYLHGGRYEFSQPLVLTKEDSGTQDAPIIWRSVSDESVVLSGGRAIQGFKPVVDTSVLDRLPAPARGKVLQSDLTAAGLKDFGEVAAIGKRVELFFGGNPMPLARWPNEGFSHVVDVVGGSPIVSHGIKGDAVGRFVYSDDEPARWVTEPEVWVSGYWFWDWSDGRQQVKSIDPATHTIELLPPHHNYGYRKGQRFYAFNVLAELDSPGEWYLDRQRGVIYFWPPTDTSDPSVTLSMTPTLLSFTNASWITLRGVLLEATRGTAVQIAGGSGVRIAGCVIRNTGMSAVGINGGTNHGVTGCDIYQTGEGGVSLNGGERKTLTPGEHFAENNHIHHFSRLVRTYRPAIGLQGVGNRASHNLIHDAPHTAILLNGNDHVTEFNEIHHVCEETGDVGAFYMGRDWTMRGNLVRHNYFHHLSGPGLHGAMAVYLDDAASGTTIFGNLFYRAGRAAFIGGGRDNLVENNVFVECEPSVHLDARGIGWMHETAEPGGFMDKRLDEVPYTLPPWSTRYPELVNIRNESPAAPRGNKIRHNVSMGGQWLNLEKAAESGALIENNLVDQDPGFVDATKMDFRLKPDSPAWALGFRRIPIENIGLHDDELRTARPTTFTSP